MNAVPPRYYFSFFRRVRATSMTQCQVEKTRVHFWTFSLVSVKTYVFCRSPRILDFLSSRTFFSQITRTIVPSPEKSRHERGPVLTSLAIFAGFTTASEILSLNSPEWPFGDSFYKLFLFLSFSILTERIFS